MASIDNRSKFHVTVKNRPDLHLTFPHNRLADLEAHMASLRAQALKPRAHQDEDQFLVRIRQKGYPPLQLTVDSCDKVEGLSKKSRRSVAAVYFLTTPSPTRPALLN